MTWGHEETTELAATELAEFDDMVDRSFMLESEIKDIENQRIKPLKDELDGLNKRILATLKHHNKDNYRANLGMVVKAEKFNVKFPKNPDDKQKLISYMGQDTYVEMSNINYNTFNSWYRGKMDEAVESGEMGFSIAGVEEPTYSEYLQRRKSS